MILSKPYKLLPFLIVFAYFVAAPCYAQNTPGLFKNNDRVCFVGNSITHEGDFTNYIALYYATRYPNKKIFFYNAGIAGDEASDMLARMDKDILIHKPTVAVLMAGMNDVRRDLYELKSLGDTAVKHQ